MSTPFPGSILVAYTDGLVERHRVLCNGTELLTHTVREARDRTAREISNEVAATSVINAPDDIAYSVIRRIQTLPAKRTPGGPEEAAPFVLHPLLSGIEAQEVAPL